MPTTFPSPLNLHDRAQIAKRAPLLIAHRGGVIAPDAPENSRRALELAAQQGYDMVELDVRSSHDGTPVLFHGIGGGGRLLVDCGIEGQVADFTAAELAKIRYRGGTETILSLDEALRFCRAWGLGIMLDIKTASLDPLPTAFLQTVAKLVEQHGLVNSVMTLSQRPEVRRHLPPSVLFAVRANTLSSMLSDDQASWAGRYWFDDPDSVTEDQLQLLRARQVLTIACINRFRYPAHSFDQLEEVDIQRMQQIPVDGYQIDSCYGHFFSKLQGVPERT